MYACLHCPQSGPELLLLLASRFSPVVEKTSRATVVFGVTGLRRMIGSPHVIASEIARAGETLRIHANLALAANPDSAILLAENFGGVTLVTPGEEQLKIGPIPLTALFLHRPSLDPALLDVLHRWGLQKCEDLAALSRKGIIERLGTPGIYLHDLACGLIDRPLRTFAPTAVYEEQQEFDTPLEILEPLLFLFSRALTDLCARLRSQSCAARALKIRLALEQQKSSFDFDLEFPVPVDDARTILKLLQLHLERHGPPGAVKGFHLCITPIDPRRIQESVFKPPLPAADKLHLTLARIRNMVGHENAGTPYLLDTHCPDSFGLRALPIDDAPEGQAKLSEGISQNNLQLAIRLFRPALPAIVKVSAALPKNVSAKGVRGQVMKSAGPWKTSGEWWSAKCWQREEWDVALDSGALYRIYQDELNSSWYVHGVYD